MNYCKLPLPREAEEPVPPVLDPNGPPAGPPIRITKDDTSPAVLNATLPPHTPGGFEEELASGREQFRASEFVNQEEYELFMMLPGTRASKMVLLAKLRSERNPPPRKASPPRRRKGGT